MVSSTVLYALIGIIGVVLLGFVSFAIYYYFFRPKPPAPPYTPEKRFDPSIKTPTGTLTLFDFSRDNSSGYKQKPICTKTWYAYRYVDVDSGSYGPLSRWSSAPIYAGATSQQLPCMYSDCDFGNTCLYNKISVGVATLDYPIISGKVANVHRYRGVSPPSASDEGEIIGYLFPHTNDIYVCIDVNFPVKENGECC